MQSVMHALCVSFLLTPTKNTKTASLLLEEGKERDPRYNQGNIMHLVAKFFEPHFTVVGYSFTKGLIEVFGAHVFAHSL